MRPGGDLDIGYEGTPKAKAALWFPTDAGVRKHGELTGLDTLVVHAVNDAVRPGGDPNTSTVSLLRSLG